MEWLIAHAEIVATLCGAALASWALVAKVDKTYRSHLKDEFATKSDFTRLEDKLDKILTRYLNAPRARRYKKRSKSSF